MVQMIKVDGKWLLEVCGSVVKVATMEEMRAIAREDKQAEEKMLREEFKEELAQ